MPYLGITNDFSSMLGTQTPTPGGKTMTMTSSGKQGSPGSGAKHTPGMSSAQVAAAVVPPKQPPMKQPKPPKPGMSRRPQFSASNPQMMVQPPPVPHPGVHPPYPDARSPQPQLLPNGTPMLPLPKGFPLGSSPLHVPPSFAPGMTGLLRR
jgi:hypothetical protein